MALHSSAPAFRHVFLLLIFSVYILHDVCGLAVRSAVSNCSNVVSISGPDTELPKISVKSSSDEPERLTSIPSEDIKLRSNPSSSSKEKVTSWSRIRVSPNSQCSSSKKKEHCYLCLNCLQLTRCWWLFRRV